MGGRSPYLDEVSERFALLETDPAPFCALVGALAGLPPVPPPPAPRPMDPAEALRAVQAGEASVAYVLDCLDLWRSQGDWVPANGGTEEPFWTQSGRRLLYCYQPRSRRHAYLDLDTDTIVADEDLPLYFAEVK